MDADNLDKLDAVIGAMTPGPWEPCPMDMYVLGGDGHFVAEVRGFGAEVSGQRPEGTQQANARGIATLRNVAPELLAVVRASRAATAPGAKIIELHGLCDALDDLDAKLAGDCGRTVYRLTGRRCRDLRHNRDRDGRCRNASCGCYVSHRRIRSLWEMAPSHGGGR